MSERVPRRPAVFRPVTRNSVDTLRCFRCGAPAVEVVENPFTNRVQCRVCGARRDLERSLDANK